jgi:cysteine synthase
VLDSIGNTPMLHLAAASLSCGADIFAKAEIMNPRGSIKDLIARHTILDRITLFTVERSFKFGLNRDTLLVAFL